jgi:hypothetical protein
VAKPTSLDFRSGVLCAYPAPVGAGAPLALQSWASAQMNIEGYLDIASDESGIHETYYGLLGCARYVEPLVLFDFGSLIG